MKARSMGKDVTLGHSTDQGTAGEVQGSEYCLWFPTAIEAGIVVTV